MFAYARFYGRIQNSVNRIKNNEIRGMCKYKREGNKM